ncbi:hypothetical protein M405DRAFT_582740 [Rhizopogon salebrosus TDB-379]|nr:hypothetical protein M405DRAFT_582740 [Rhizopogon salebrosus TDB-379]
MVTFNVQSSSLIINYQSLPIRTNPSEMSTSSMQTILSLYPLSTSTISVPVPSPSTVPAPDTESKTETTPESPHPNGLSTPDLDGTTSTQSGSLTTPSPIASCLASTPSGFTPASEAQDTATSRVSVPDTSFTIQSGQSPTLPTGTMTPESDSRTSAGSSRIVDLGENTETDRAQRNSTVDSYLASTAPPLPSAPLPTTPIGPAASALASPPSPSSPSPCRLPASPATPPRLVLLPTSTEMFPSTTDTFDRWREDVAIQMNSLEIEAPSMEHTDSRASLPPPGLQQGEVNPRASRSERFLQKVKKIGSRVRCFITRKKRSSEDGRSEDGRIEVMVAVRSSPYDMRPSMYIPHDSKQLTTSASMLSLWAPL